jgi:hypothetical protein
MKMKTNQATINFQRRSLQEFRRSSEGIGLNPSFLRASIEAQERKESQQESDMPCFTTSPRGTMLIDHSKSTPSFVQRPASVVVGADDPAQFGPVCRPLGCRKAEADEDGAVVLPWGALHGLFEAAYQHVHADVSVDVDLVSGTPVPWKA